jgi:conjugal transfer/entry exclusion protein
MSSPHTHNDDLTDTALPESNGTTARNIVMEVGEMEAIEKRFAELYEAIDKKNAQINDLQPQLKEAKQLGARIADAVRPDLMDVIKLIAEQGSHSWRNERSLSAIFKLTELLGQVSYLCGKIQNVDKPKDEWEF